MSDQQVPTAPNYGPMIAGYNSIASNAAANGQNANTQLQADVNKGSTTTNGVVAGDVGTQGTFQGAAGTQLGNSQALQQQGTNYIQNEVQRYSDPSQVASDMGASEATTGQAMDAARNNSIQQLESFGVNPASTRFAGLDAGLNAQKAAAQAAAGTTAQTTDRTLADNANGQLLNQGNTENSQANQTASTGTNAGTSAAGVQTANTASTANALGTNLAWTNPQIAALGGATNAQNTGFNNQAESDKIANSSSSGLGSLLGIGASMFGKGGAFGAGGALAGLALADGGKVPDGNTGGVIPDSASPSGGAVTDDIQASTPQNQNIRLNGGEAIVPKDVTQFYGDKFFLDLIQKARKAMQPDQVQQGGPPKFPGAIPSAPGGTPSGGQGPMQQTAAVGGYNA